MEKRRILKIDFPVDRQSGQLYSPEWWKDLDQDVLMVNVGDYGVDVGWFPEYQKNGRYILRWFKGDWDNALIPDEEYRDPEELKKRIEELCRESRSLSSQPNS